MTTTLPLDLGPLRVEAERLAKELHLAGMMRWGETAHATRDLLTERQAMLLRDLTRPASRDFWVRWLEDGFSPSPAVDYCPEDNRDNPEALRAAVLAVARQ